MNRSIRLLTVALLGVLLVSPATAHEAEGAAGSCRLDAAKARPAASVEPCCDRAALNALQKLAAGTAAYSPELADRIYRLTRRIWGDPLYRHQVSAILNQHGGYLDAMLNRVYVDEWHRTGEHLPNFHDVDGKLFRGGQPSEEGFKRLKEQGIATVVNLRAEERGEEAVVKKLGMRYVGLPIADTEAPSYGQVNEFLGLLHDASSGKVFVHCAAGANRTGTMVALWRVETGMSAEKALKEAAARGFRESILAADREAALVRGFVRRRTAY